MIKLMLSQLQNNMKSKVLKKHNNLPVQMFKNVQLKKDVSTRICYKISHPILVHVQDIICINNKYMPWKIL